MAKGNILQIGYLKLGKGMAAFWTSHLMAVQQMDSFADFTKMYIHHNRTPWNNKIYLNSVILCRNRQTISVDDFRGKPLFYWEKLA